MDDVDEHDRSTHPDPSWRTPPLRPELVLWLGLGGTALENVAHDSISTRGSTIAVKMSASKYTATTMMANSSV